MFNNFLFTFMLALSCVNVALADPITYTRCTDDGTFNLHELDIQGCNTTVCNIHAGQTYTIKFSGCYSGPKTVPTVNMIPFDVKGGAANINIFNIAHGDLCEFFTADSPVTECPASIPKPGGACGKWAVNVRIPFYPLGVFPWLGLPGTVDAMAWANVETTKPVVCLQFGVTFFTL